MLSVAFASLGQDSVEKRHISSAQLETVVYACMRFQHQLPSGAAACPGGLLLACLTCTLSAHYRLHSCLASLASQPYRVLPPPPEHGTDCAVVMASCKHALALYAKLQRCNGYACIACSLHTL
jgi:hypothetical protein